MKLNNALHAGIIFAVTAILLFIAPAVSLTKETPVAGRISALQGTVTVTAGVKPGPVRLFDAVHGKDRLALPENASVRIIYYEDTHEEMIKGKCTAELTDKGATITGGGKDCLVITRRPPKLTVAPNPSRSGRSIAAIAMRGGAPVPRGNFMEVTETPTFIWNEVSSAGFYEFILTEMTGDSQRPVLDKVVSEPRFTVPGRLTFGKQYAIELKAFIEDPGDPANKGLESNEIAPVHSAPGMKNLYLFTLPSKEVVDFIKEEERKFGTLSRGGSEWRAAAPYLIFLYLEYGLTDRAGFLAHEMCDYEKNNEFLQDIEQRFH
jgi:hypothetical protein